MEVYTKERLGTPSMQACKREVEACKRRRVRGWWRRVRAGGTQCAPGGGV